VERQTGNPREPATRRERVLVGGIVAHNEERTLERAVRSLVAQELPSGVRWGTIWIVASGCTDSTVSVAERLAGEDPRLRLVVEPERKGKSRAVSEVVRRAEGDLLVLLNADAVAEPGALRALLRDSEGAIPPFAVMARPLPRVEPPTPLGRMVALLWDVHHELHLEVPIAPEGSNLSDELLLLSLPQVRVLREGIINDGASLGVCLRRNGGSVRYSPAAVVRIAVPSTLVDFLRQRRRIRTGYGQIAREFGTSPMTLPRLAITDPHRALRVLGRSLRSGRYGLRDLGALVVGEISAFLLSTWDALPPRKDHVNWERIGPAAPALEPVVRRTPPPTVPRTTPDARIEALLRVAQRHRAGLTVDELVSLLPSDGPLDRAELLRWAEGRSDLVRLDGDHVYPTGAAAIGAHERRARAERYQTAARALVAEHLAPVMPWVRCVGITGSTAYGMPERGDDLDLFVVTRRGALWVFLTYTYLAVRLRYGGGRPEERPTPCFNFALDDDLARREFVRPQGLLFAREALTARILHGDDYYGALLAASPWLREELPRLYDERRLTAVDTTLPPVPVLVRVLNSALYLPVAAYLHLVGLRRSARVGRDGESHGRFRVVTGSGRLSLVTERFELIRSELERPVPAGPPLRSSFDVAGANPMRSAISKPGRLVRADAAASDMPVPTAWRLARADASGEGLSRDGLAAEGVRP